MFLIYGYSNGFFSNIFIWFFENFGFFVEDFFWGFVKDVLGVLMCVFEMWVCVLWKVVDDFGIGEDVVGKRVFVFVNGVGVFGECVGVFVNIEGVFVNNMGVFVECVGVFVNMYLCFGDIY